MMKRHAPRLPLPMPVALIAAGMGTIASCYAIAWAVRVVLNVH